MRVHDPGVLGLASVRKHVAWAQRVHHDAGADRPERLLTADARCA
jgi:hypothetical protein